MSNVILTPNNLPILSKGNAKAFHEEVKARILESGDGLFEYIETIKFFSALDKQIMGDSAAKIDSDKELIDLIREEITIHNGKIITERGVIFQNAETGTSYDYSNCDDPILLQLEAEHLAAANSLKERKEFLKKVPTFGVEIRFNDELVTIYPPSKSSKSSFKVQLPK